MSMFLLLALGQFYYNNEYDPLPPKQMFIYIDDSRESQILKSELTRNWCHPNAKPNQPASALYAEMEARRQRVAVRCTVMDLPFQLRDKPCPCYRFGEYGTWTAFDPRTFSGDACCLITIETMIHNQEADLSEWKADCEDIIYGYRVRYINEVYTFLSSKNSEIDIETFYNEVYNNVSSSEEYIAKTYGHLEGLPVYTPPALPRSPIWKFPHEWERWMDR